jgi:hypothetical protein
VERTRLMQNADAIKHSGLSRLSIGISANLQLEPQVSHG